MLIMESKDLVNDNIYIIRNEVKFSLTISGKLLDAEFIWAKRRPDGEYLLEFKFSDGHEDLFRLTDLKVYNSRKKIDKYGAALFGEIYLPLFAFEPEDEVYVRYVKALNANLWVVRHKSDSFFSCYLHNDLFLCVEPNELSDESSVFADKKVIEQIFNQLENLM
jgi:hypothetical protein